MPLRILNQRSMLIRAVNLIRANGFASRGISCDHGTSKHNCANNGGPQMWEGARERKSSRVEALYIKYLAQIEPGLSEPGVSLAASMAVPIANG